MHVSVFMCMYVEARGSAGYLPQFFSPSYLFFNNIYSFVFMCVCMYVCECACVFVYMHMCRCSQKPEEEVRSPSDGVNL